MNPGFNAALNTTVRALFLSVSLLVYGNYFVCSGQALYQRWIICGAIESVLSETIGLTVTLGPLKGDWPRLLPVIDFSSVVINDADDLPSVALQNVRAELDLFRSLRHFNLVWRELSVGDLALFMVQDEQGS